MLPVQEGAAAGAERAGAAASRIRERLAWSLAAILAAASVALLLHRPVAAPVGIETRALIAPPAGTRFDFAAERSGSLSISPDGRQITFSVQSPTGDTSLWIRPVDSLEGRALPGTKSATWPFWSPDGRYIAFFADGKMKKIDLAGSPPIAICDAKDGRGGSWGRDGIILFTPNPNTGIFSVPAAGGTPQQQTTLDEAHGETTHRWSTFLPDGRHFLYMAGTHDQGVRSEINAVYVAELGKPGSRRLLLGRSNVAYASGHLLYVRDRVLLAQPFDPDRLELSGEPVPLADGVAYEQVYFRGVDAVSENGLLVFMRGTTTSGSRLAWYGRDGKPVGKATDLGTYEQVALSPEGNRVAFTLADPDSGTKDIWILDLLRGVRSRLTFGASNEFAPTWSPDGTRIVYGVSSLVDNLFVRPAGGGDEQPFLTTKSDKRPTDWSRDGRILIFNHLEATPNNKNGVWVWPVVDKADPRPFVDTEFNETDGRLSPDGRWMLYASDESGRYELYVAPFPGPGGKWQVSAAGVITGWWTLGGKEIIYAAPDLTIRSVTVRATGATFEADAPRLLFPEPLMVDGTVTPDGRRFLLAVRPETDQNLPVTLVTNWMSGLRR
jgi:Tol biopolymer transport system component